MRRVLLLQATQTSWGLEARSRAPEEHGARAGAGLRVVVPQKVEVAAGRMDQHWEVPMCQTEEVAGSRDQTGEGTSTPGAWVWGRIPGHTLAQGEGLVD